jgi:peptidoglycan/LPS O-acetylase OafA/YrhL
VLYALLPWLSSHHYPAAVEGHHSWYVFGMNLLTMQNIFVPPYEGVFWSLSIEIHLYILYPILLAVSRKYGAERMLLVSFLGTVGYLMASLLAGGDTAIGHGILFGHALFYWFTWCCGAYVAELQFGRAKGFAAVRWMWPILLAAGAGLYLVGMEHVGERVVAALHARVPRLNFDTTQIMGAGEISLAIAMATLLAGSLRESANRLWTSPVGRSCAFVGLFSYSLYAIHAPILIAFAALTGGKTESMTIALLGCGCAIVVAYGFFNVIERWTLNPPKRFWVLKRSEPVLAAVVVEPAVETVAAES